MNRRGGFTLLELIVVVAILAVLVGLLIPAVQRVRAAAAAARQRNQIRQIVLALHNYASTNGDRIPGRQGDPNYTGAFPFMYLLSYLEVPEPHWGTDRYGGWTVNAPPFYSSTDPSLTAAPEIGGAMLSTFERQGPASFALCSPGFSGRPSLPAAYPDGTSNTLALAEHYYICGKRSNTILYSGQLPNTALGPTLTSYRSASFADSVWGDVVPVRSPTGGPTVASVPGATFQVMPRIEDADGRLPQAFLPGGLTVALFDGSARTLRPGIAEAVFWAMTTPDGGEVNVD